MTYFWWIILCISAFPINILAAENSPTSIKTHYRISSASLAILGQRVEQELLSIRSGEGPQADETLESFVQKLSPRQFTRIIEQQIGRLSYEQVEFELGHALEPYYRHFIDKLSDEDEELISKSIDLIKQSNKASTSYLQRNFQIGYNKAARIMEALEQRGVVSTPNHAGKREILINN